ncbi:NAD-dependent epimerase/dehydratase family protein [Methylomicrobium sp. Wu6]|uniref:NAD-dependent epimerase/dehydratase family protein n=1 Tax=Methylomicrobium sp. Wu6 TaxID=3107928 RepID=UPI002DD6AFDD|nr:NAD-dependent epimerase/dehydratase family protein [Methylomicrobium sp. Wu6]MEC4747378.1 NAD-dependent epimerase/dehydratase family protein [Methylomicrobium sp. Wu6]
MIIAVTGGTGFIGRHLIARHLARGDEVRYLTRGNPLPALAGAIACKGNLNSPSPHLRKFLEGTDVLYHCAAELRDEALMQATNAQGTANLLAAARGEITRWVQLSSTGVYGNPRHQIVSENSAIAPVNAYERSKTEADALLTRAAAEQQMECVLLRPSNVYGIDMPNQSLFQMVGMIDKGLFFFIGKPGAVANYIHVENVVDALMLCGKADLPANGQAYIVSDHCPLEEFVDIVAVALHKKPGALRLPESWARGIAGLGAKLAKFPLTASRIDAMTNTTIYQSDKIASELGFRQTISIREGIAELTRHWQTHRQ